jgi:Flp pilus assembly protein TadG
MVPNSGQIELKVDATNRFSAAMSNKVLTFVKCWLLRDNADQAPVTFHVQRQKVLVPTNDLPRRRIVESVSTSLAKHHQLSLIG